MCVYRKCVMYAYVRMVSLYICVNVYVRMYEMGSLCMCVCMSACVCTYIWVIGMSSRECGSSGM